MAVLVPVFGAGTLALFGRLNAGGGAVTEFMHVHGLSVPAWAPESVYVSTHAGLLRFTGEGGWELVSRELHDFMGFQAHPTREGVMYSSGHPAPGSGLPNPVGLMVSEDAGVTWQIRSLGAETDFHVSAVQPTDGDTYYGYFGDLYRTVDGGRSWSRTPGSSLAVLGGVFSLAVHPEEPDTIVAGTESGLWRSPDAGGSWEILLGGAPVTAVATAAWGPQHLLAYVVASDGGLLRSDDGGRSWSSLGFFAADRDAVAYIAPHPTDQSTIVLGTFGESIYRSRDGGETWSVLASSGRLEREPVNRGDVDER